MTMLDKIKAFFKRPKPEAKAAEKKEVSGETRKGVRDEVTRLNPGD